MAFTVQSEDGTTEGANAYITVAYFKSYHDDRGNSYGSASDSAIEKAIVKATDYLDNRFDFLGWARNRPQSTAWPRTNALNVDGFYETEIPVVVKRATAEYALRALSAALMPDPERDASGLTVMSKEEKVGPISEKTEFRATGYSLPKYPLADAMLTRSGLIQSGRRIVRA